MDEVVILRFKIALIEEFFPNQPVNRIQLGTERAVTDLIPVYLGKGYTVKNAGDTFMVLTRTRRKRGTLNK